jgi:two-component system, NtrC family, response regulator HydG
MARILLVEDDVDVCQVMQHALVDGGHQVDVSGTVLSGLGLFGCHPYELVVTDGRLPDGTGVELADRAREKGIPVLIVTGYAFNLPMRDLNRFEFLLKPLRPNELLQAVERSLRAEKT